MAENLADSSNTNPTARRPTQPNGHAERHQLTRHSAPETASAKPVLTDAHGSATPPSP